MALAIASYVAARHHGQGQKKTLEGAVSIGKILLYQTACNLSSASTGSAVLITGAVLQISTNEIRAENVEYRDSRDQSQGTGGLGSLI